MAKGISADKVRNLTPEEMAQQQRDLNDQLFRLKFQMKMGQTESLQKIRGLRRDIARLKTVERERVLAGDNGAAVTVKKTATAKAEPRAAKKAEKKSATTGRK